MYFCVVLCIFCVALCILLCCSMYFCVVLCIFCFALCIFYVVLCDICFVTFLVLFVCICVLNNCHRVATQLQLNISYHSYKEPTRCNRVVEFIITVFLNCSTCFGRHNAYHQELKNFNCSLWLYIRF
jgi:hypothetical protein